LAKDQTLPNKETYSLPCQDKNQAWGCIRFRDWYKLKPVAKGNPDPNGQDDWEFDRVDNPRKCND
jgi:hypothetical protein